MRILLLVFIFRAFLSFLIPPVADESYYIMWAQHLDWSYIDHPGMVAWILSGFELIFRDPFISARMTAITLYGLLLGIIYQCVKDLGQSREKAIGIALFFLLIPFHFVIGMTYQVENPLLLGAAFTLWGWIRLIRFQKSRYFYWIVAGLIFSFYSKFTVLILALGLLYLILIDPNKRKWLRLPHFWASIAIGLIALLPFVIWQHHHHWISFIFHIDRIGGSGWFSGFFDFLANQILYLSPVLIALLIVCFKRKEPLSHSAKDHLKLAAVLWVSFLLLSIKTTVYPHWPMIATIPLTLALAECRIIESKKWQRAMGIFTGVLVMVLLVLEPTYLKSKVRNNWKVAQTLNQKINTSFVPVTYLSDFHGSVGILSLYLHRNVGMTQVIHAENPRWGAQQIGIWETTEVKKGNNALLWIDPTPEILNILNTNFTHIEILPKEKLNLLEAHISRKQFIWCTEAKKRTVL